MPRPDPPGFFPEPLVIPPLRPPHKNTFILLHGRGSNASIFGPALLSTPFPLPPASPSQTSAPQSKPEVRTPELTTLRTLRTLLPHTKFIFPTAPRSRATIYKRSLIPQWFDSWHINHEPPPLARTTPSGFPSPSQPSSPSSCSSSASDLSQPPSPSEAGPPSPAASPPPLPPPLEPLEATALAETTALLAETDTAAATHATHATQAGQAERRALAESYRVVPGLRQTVTHLHALIRAEADLLAPGGGTVRDIVIGGLSQGCAASLMAYLLWDAGVYGDEDGVLGGFVGMCGWLPFGREVVRGVLDGGVEGEEGEDGDGGFDPFERDEDEVEDEEGGGDGDGEVVDVAASVVRALRERLEMKMEGKDPQSRPKGFDTPVFLGHGDLDEKVHVGWGGEAAECLKKLGVDVSWREYQGLGHWYSPAMLTDIAEFLRSKAGCETNKVMK